MVLFEEEVLFDVEESSLELELSDAELCLCCSLLMVGAAADVTGNVLVATSCSSLKLIGMDCGEEEEDDAVVCCC